MIDPLTIGRARSRLHPDGAAFVQAGGGFQQCKQAIMRFAPLLLIVSLSVGAAPQSAQDGELEFELTRSSIGSGTAFSSGGGFEMSATIGQPTAGASSGGAFTMTSGFWFELAAGDCDDDGVVGRFDFAAFHACLSGPGVLLPIEPCACQDLVASNTVDLGDFAVFQRNYTAP